MAEFGLFLIVSQKTFFGLLNVEKKQFGKFDQNLQHV